eukprot:TRINITY_DN475_c0_g1_i1.p1 TRINITY_DN475_c0_g1~~TRINITY_DN475_c0_g1_i1.p1  ORF type:complete len:316 (+),score=83.32 TRINITY_DN475_c0_g1_i1:236-1183(+)
MACYSVSLSLSSASVLKPTQRNKPFLSTAFLPQSPTGRILGFSKSFAGSTVSKISRCRVVFMAQQSKTEVLKAEEVKEEEIKEEMKKEATGTGDGARTALGIVAETEGTASVNKPNVRRPSPLQKGGTLSGDAAKGMDPSPAALAEKNGVSVSSEGFSDPRWTSGTWDLQKFTKDGKVDWDAVIDAEVLRRKWLEENPEASSKDNPVVFDTSVIPWWAWMKRFHLPQAELLNGRAAMIGFFMAYFIDSLTGIGIVDQTSSFFGKVLLFIAVSGVLLIRKNEDLQTLKQLVKESTFYDKQWQATWSDETSEQSEQE